MTELNQKVLSMIHKRKELYLLLCSKREIHKQIYSEIESIEEKITELDKEITVFSK